VKQVNPSHIDDRLKRVRKHRGHWISPGPNYLWSVDAHLKLQFWGIEIYASIDTYARYITWIYVGISATTAVSCVRQYLNTIQDIGFAPKMIRSDRGSETALIADAHWTLVRSLNPDTPLKDCYRFGTSKENQRIESLWNQLSKGCLFQWRVRYYRTAGILPNMLIELLPMAVEGELLRTR
jgi:hypothetical protein